MTTYGKIGEFKESEESWTQYIERLEQYFLANDVEDAGKKRAILLSVCGSKTYALARDLLQPARPAETTFKKIVETLEKHYSPRPSEIVERFKFHSRNRKEDEGVATYVAVLRKLSEHCNYGETLPEMLRDRLVCGINNEKIQRRLLAEPDLTLKKAEEIALAMELASKHVVDIQSTETTPSKVHQINSAGKNKGKNPASNSECYRCGEKHEASTCRFKEVECFKCGKRGHLAKACRSTTSGKTNKGKKKKEEKKEQPWKKKEEKKEQSTHLVKEISDEEDVYVETMYHIVSENKLRPYEVSLELLQ